MAKIILKNISKMFPNNEIALSDVSFEASEGEFIVLVGPSGCGKTTLLRLIAGLEDLSSGEILFDDVNVNCLPPKERDVGFVFQNYALYPHLTVFENIAFPLRIRRIDKREIKKQTMEVIDLLSLSDYTGKKPRELSGGQRQRVALGRAIIRKPKVFLFDEPLSNLDAKLRVQMRTEIINLQRQLGITSIYVTHDQIEAMTMGSRLVVLNKGKVCQIGSPEELYRNPENIFVAGFIGSPQINLFHGKLLHLGNLMFIEDSSGVKFPVLEAIFLNGLPEDGSKITIGIRPEHLKLNKYDINLTPNFEAEVIGIEYIGHESLIYFRTAGEIKCCRTKGLEQIVQGNMHTFVIDIVNLMAFDNNGLRL
jgi:multiple sugar transport system ATP-binding protein